MNIQKLSNTTGWVSDDEFVICSTDEYGNIYRYRKHPLTPPNKPCVGMEDPSKE